MVNSNICAEVVTQYIGHLADQFGIEDAGSGCTITTPFTRPDGEFVMIAIEALPHDQIRLTDMGDTLGYLYVNGLTLSRNLITTARNLGRDFGVSLSGSQFVIQPTDLASLGPALHSLIQTILPAADLIQRRRPGMKIRFETEVESLFFSTGNVYDVDYQVPGERSAHTVKFHIDSGRHILVQPLSSASESVAFSWAERWAYRFRDIIGRDDRWRCFAVLDDRGTRSTFWSERTVAPISEYTVLWTDRGKLEEALSGEPAG